MYVYTIIYVCNEFYATLRTGRTAAALSDACKCIEIDAQWPKGYARKGDANHALGKYTEAYNAYNAGLRIAPNDASLKEKAELAMNAIRGQADTSRPSTTGSAPAGVNARLSSIQAMCKALVVLGALAYCIPFTGRLSSVAYKVYCLAALSDFAIALFAAHGMPQMNMNYAQRVLPDPSTM
jgi:tetratricopeptide (TPR) repeat protein